MCEHKHIYHSKKNFAYCKDCKTTILLPKNWTKEYKETTKVNEYKKI